MSKAQLPNSQSSLEPMELRLLKQQLAQVNCKCSGCQHSWKPQPQKQLPRNTHKDIEVQAEHSIPLESKLTYTESNIKDALCPTCCMTLNILRGGVVKILKDEESETLSSMFTKDKSIGKRIKSAEKTTSITCKPLPQYSNLTLCDYISEGSVETILPKVPSNLQRKRCHHDRVKFVDSPRRPEEVQPRLDDRCVCLQNFMDAIRPPLP